eukprot:TRINITY_DN16271_c0_g1_i2.p1 TRINITY_DN16271_c0_g1~~TRINITY_DN16271_c0_g1_i2.p1  ORF type:complete len:434 (-),score=76.06 TRINITY_DN16271_c0_g1_i2:40-1341(-)
MTNCNGRNSGTSVGTGSVITELEQRDNPCETFLTYVYLALEIVFKGPLVRLILVLQGLLELRNAPKYLVNRTLLAVQADKVGMSTDSLEVSLEVLNQAKSSSGLDAEALKGAALYKYVKHLAKKGLKKNMGDAKSSFGSMSWHRRIFLLTRVFHLGSSCMLSDLFVSHTARVAVAMTDLLGAAAGIMLFYSNSDGTTSFDHPNPEACKVRSVWIAELVRTVTVGVICAYISGGIAGMLMGIRSKVRLMAEGAETEKEEKKRIKDGKMRLWIFWALLISYWTLCLYIVCVFLATVDEASTFQWLESFAWALLEKIVLESLLLAIFFATASTLIFTFSPGLWQGLNASEEQTSAKSAWTGLNQIVPSTPCASDETLAATAPLRSGEVDKTDKDNLPTLLAPAKSSNNQARSKGSAVYPLCGAGSEEEVDDVEIVN